MRTPVIAEREQGRITLFFHQKQAPPTLPYELSGHVSADAWASRVPQILRLTSRFNHPRLEAVWIITSFIVSIVVPAIFNNIILNALNGGLRDKTRTFFAAHFISFALFVGVVLAFWVPLLAWKYIGQQRANVLSRRWVGEDSRGIRYSGYVPLWRIRLPGVISNSTRVTINLPAGPQPTSAYNSTAYPPSWVNERVDSRRVSNPFTDQKIGSMDALPLYDDKGAQYPLDEKAPVYYGINERF